MNVGLAPGAVVHGYRLEAEIGRGGMGVVHRAVRLDTGARVAIKSMLPEVAERPLFRKRFLREARAAMVVSHPNIVRIYEVFEQAGTPMLAMELLEGESLEALLERETRIPIGRLARILVYVTSALGTAHSLGIVHRDIKPENIFVCGDTQDVKVLDFGIAKFTATEGSTAATAALTRTGALLGTPYYMAPEQAFGEKRIDHRADVWALGIVIYRCLSGTLPTMGPSFGEIFRKVVAAKFAPLSTLVPDIPPEIEDLVRRMLQARPDDRPADLREVHAVLARYAALPAPTFGAAVQPIWDESSATQIPTPTSAGAPTEAPARPAATSGLQLRASALPRQPPLAARSSMHPSRAARSAPRTASGP